MVNLINPDSIAFIDKFGFPVFIATINLSIIGLMIRRDAVRQDKTEARFDNLLNKLFESLSNIANKNEAIAKETNTELRNIAIHLESITVKIDTYTQLVEDQRDHTMIFKSEDDIRRRKH